MNQTRSQHRQEVLTFLQNHVSARQWELTEPPSGRGHETYIARNNETAYFIKLGAHTHRYQTAASLSLTPPVIKTGQLNDGSSILIQHYVAGRHPSWHDFQHHLETIASIIQKTHHHPAMQAILEETQSTEYQDIGMAAKKRIQQKWARYRNLVPAVSTYVDEALMQLETEINQFVGDGLVASHNDLCNGNWLISTNEDVYLLDLDAMSLDDPAHDMGSLLWWYYPPELRQRFLEIAGYQYDEAFKNRMRVRMALHCLDILLPRPQSFDKFNAALFPEWLTDFKHAFEGKENPRGYDD